MFEIRLAAFLSHCQGLNERQTISNAAVLEQFGWARSVGGVNPYLTLFARNGPHPREIEAEVKEDSFAEFASARGCTYFLPKSHYKVGIKCGQGFNELATFRTAQTKLGFTEADLLDLNSAILQGLENGPADTGELKKRLGSVVKNFGELGKKVGQTTSLSLGLLSLQSNAKIRRFPIGGRLDHQSYRYGPFDSAPDVSDDFPKENAYQQLAFLFWGWMGLATVEHFLWFSGLPKKVGLKAVQHLQLKQVNDSELLGKVEKIEELESFSFPDQPAYRLLSSLDSLFLARRDLSLHISPDDLEHPLLSLDRGLQDLSYNAIVDRGRIIGVWEFEFASQKVVYSTFVDVEDSLKREIESTEQMIRDELGDARTFSLDSPKSRVAKINFLKEFSA